MRAGGAIHFSITKLIYETDLSLVFVPYGTIAAETIVLYQHHHEHANSYT